MGMLTKALTTVADWVSIGFPERMARGIVSGDLPTPPEEVVRRVASGELPMDEASIAKRIEEQYNPEIYYRGSWKNEAESGRDMWMTTSPTVADTYAMNEKGTRRLGPTYPLRHNAKNLAEVRGNGVAFNKVTTNSNKLKGLQADPASKGVHVGTDNIARAVKESGSYDGTRFNNIADEFNIRRGAERSDVVNVLASRPDIKVRHRDAVYDPEYNGPNIMGGALAGAVGLGALSQSEEADAAALKLLKNMTPEMATSQIKNRLNKDRFKGISPNKSVTDYVHNNTTYDRGFLSDIKRSGEQYGGPTYRAGVTDFAKELLASTDDPNVKSAIMDWVQPRLARGGQVAAVTAAAAGANRAAAEDEAPKEKEQGSIGKVLTQMEELDLIPDAGARAMAMAFLKRELDAAIKHIEMPAQGLWGTARGLFGLATDEAPADTRRAMKEVYTQPTEQSLERAGTYVLKETGSPAAAAATSTLGMLTDPSFWF